MFETMVLRCQRRLADAEEEAASCQPGSETHRLMMLSVFALEDTYFSLVQLATGQIADQEDILGLTSGDKIRRRL